MNGGCGEGRGAYDDTEIEEKGMRERETEAGGGRGEGGVNRRMGDC